MIRIVKTGDDWSILYEMIERNERRIVRPCRQRLQLRTDVIVVNRLDESWHTLPNISES